MENLKIQLNRIKQMPMLQIGIGWVFLFCCALFCVYFTRVVYSPPWLSQMGGTSILFAIFTLIYFGVILTKKLTKGNSAAFMTGLIFISGVVFCFVNPPNQVPDESSHFLRSYAMSMGDFDFDENQQWPNDVNLLIEHFPVAYNNGYPAKEGNTIYNRFTEYFSSVNDGQVGKPSGIIIFQTIPYLPQAAGIFIARLFQIGALGAYYCGRLGNLLFYCGCCYFALKSAKRFNIILFSLMILPLTVFVAASNSNDGMLFGLMFCAFATVLSGHFDAKASTVFLGAMAVLCTSKISYIVFFLLLLAINPKEWELRIKKWQYLLISIFGFLVLYQGMGLYVTLLSNYGEIPRTMSDSDPTRQLAFILSNPIRYIVVFLDTLRNNSFFLSSGGLLGWIDVDLKLVSFFTPLILLVNTFKNAQRINGEDTRKIMVFLACSVLTYCVVLSGLYVSWTPVTLPQIIGVQMRYLMPAFMGILLSLALGFSKYMHHDPTSKRGEMGAIYTSFLFCIGAAVLLFANYYLPTKVIVYVS
ncbi:MAG: DUF2142 domain-containing protein [Oscillospiraceae bacterium]